MIQELQDFIDTLPDDIQASFSPDMKNRRACTELERLGIDVPEDVQEALNDYSSCVHQHDYVMDSMRPGMENVLDNLQDAISRI